MAEPNWRGLTGVDDRSPIPTEAPSRSEGDLSRNSYRPSAWPRLATRAVANDDGSPIAAGTELLLRELLAENLGHIDRLAGLLDALVGGLPAFGSNHELLTSALTSVAVLGPFVIPGIGAGVAYASGDAFGTVMQIVLPRSGVVLHSVVFHDPDNERVQKDITIYNVLPTDTTADNVAFDPPDADTSHVVGAFSIGLGDYIAYANSAVGVVRGLNLPLTGDASNRVWLRLVTRGADNIAAGSQPFLSLGLI